MKLFLKVAATAAFVVLAAPIRAEEAPVTPPVAPQIEDTAKKAQQDEAERQLLVAMFAIRDYCKQTLPDRAKDIDATWTKNTADVPAPLIEFSKTPNFAGMVEERIKSFNTGNSNPEYAARLKASCDQMLQ